LEQLAAFFFQQTEFS